MPSFSAEKSRRFNAAAFDGDLSLVETLSRDPEVNLNWQDDGGWSPFSLACWVAHVEMIRYLLDFQDQWGRRTIDYNLADLDGNTPLLWACSSGNEEVVEMLLADERIQVFQDNNREETPLWHAACRGDLRVVKLILASGRPIDALKRDGFSHETAAEVARRIGGRNQIVSLLEAYQTDSSITRAELRKELRLSDQPLAGELFALVVFLSDGYFKIRGEARTPTGKFFSVALRLPMELQMMLCNRVFGLADLMVKGIYSDRGFRKFAK